MGQLQQHSENQLDLLCFESNIQENAWLLGFFHLGNFEMDDSFVKSVYMQTNNTIINIIVTIINYYISFCVKAYNL